MATDIVSEWGSWKRRADWGSRSLLSEISMFYFNRENRRLCRGGSGSLTFPGVVFAVAFAEALKR
jgi:hypothetical protein